MNEGRSKTHLLGNGIRRYLNGESIVAGGFTGLFFTVSLVAHSTVTSTTRKDLSGQLQRTHYKNTFAQATAL